MVTTIYAINLVGGTITTSGSTLVGCTSIGNANTTGNATTCTNFNNGTSSSSGGDVVATTFKGPTNTSITTPASGLTKISAFEEKLHLSASSTECNCSDTGLTTTFKGTSITQTPPLIMDNWESFSAASYVDVPITIDVGESVDIRFYLYNAGTAQYLKVFANTATSLSNPRTSSILSTGGLYGTTTNRLCETLLEDNAGNCFTITVTKDSGFVLVYMSGVFMLDTGSMTQSFCTFTGYHDIVASGAMTNLRVKIDTGNISGKYYTEFYKA